MLLFTYCDVDFYDRDLRLFDEGAWLNDTAIHFCFRSMDAESACVKLIDPAVVSFLRLQVEEEEEFEELRAGLELHRYDWLFLPINDNVEFHGSSNHWSLLVCHLATGTLVSVDSSGQYNMQSTLSLLSKLARLIAKPCLPLAAARCPQQSNGNDCGIFVVMFAESLLAFIAQNPTDPVNEEWIARASEHLLSHVSSKQASQTRQRFKRLALKLAQQSGSS